MVLPHKRGVVSGAGKEIELPAFVSGLTTENVGIDEASWPRRGRATSVSIQKKSLPGDEKKEGARAAQKLMGRL